MVFGIALTLLALTAMVLVLRRNARYVEACPPIGGSDPPGDLASGHRISCLPQPLEVADSRWAMSAMQHPFR